MRAFLHTIFLCFFLINAQAQDNQFKEPIPRTPNAASLGKYGDIPVSYHTGVPNISIPIYIVEEGNLSLPISLSYHSSGIKVDEVASWVGLGWSLNAGGVIARTIMGGRDEGLTTVYGGFSSRVGWGWYKNHGAPPEIQNPYICDPLGNPNSTVNPNNPNDPYTNRAYFIDAANGFVDTEPDLFTFNFQGYSGKFFFDESGKIYTVPWEDVYIKPLNDQLSHWIAITPDGTKYFFGEINATEKNYSSIDGLSSFEEQFNSSTNWYLYRIESVNGKHWIQLSYTSEDYSFCDRTSHSVSFGTTGTLKSGSPTTAPGALVVNSVKGKRISKIETSSGLVIVDFIASHTRQDLNALGSPTNVNTQSKALTSIKITASGGTCLEYSLSQDYFVGSTVPSYTGSVDVKRLRLNSIQERSCDGTNTKNPHVFTYNNTQMARRYSLARDHWGYFNGSNTNTSLIPNGIEVPGRAVVNGGANRSVSETHSKAGILLKIKYPTSGESIFDYENHKDSNNQNIGGLRIKTVTTTTIGGSQDIIKVYTYSSPQIYSVNPNAALTDYYLENPRSNIWLSGTYNYGADFGYIINSTPPVPQYTTQGYHIGYRSVTENYSDGGKIQYVYSDINTQLRNYGYPEIPSLSPVGKGLLIDEKYMDNMGNAVKSTYNNLLVSSNWKTITVKKVASVYDYSSYCKYPYLTFPLIYQCDLAAYELYDISTVRSQLSQKIEMIDGVTTTTTYMYDPTNKHGNPIKMNMINSKDQIVETDIVYPSDAGSGAPVQMYDPNNSKYKNMLGVAINQKTKVDGIETSKSHNVYAYNSSDDMIHLTSTRMYPTGGTEYKDVFFNYDQNDNIISVEPQSNKKISYIWSINNSLPVIKGDNVDYSTLQGAVNTAVSSVGYANLNSLMNALIGKMHNETGNLRNLWKSFNTNLRNNSNLSSALIYTYTYDPLSGMTSQTDPAGITTYFEYDSLGRLQSISDPNNHILNSYQYIYKQ